MLQGGKHMDSLGWWIQGVIFDKLAVDTSDSLGVFNACAKYQPCGNPEVIVTEVFDSVESSCDGALERCLPLSPTKEQLSVLIDSNSPRHSQLAAVFQLSDSPRSRSRSISPSPLSLQFIRSIESDSRSEQAVLEEPRGKFFRTATSLNSKLEDLNVDAGNMLCEMVLLKHGLQVTLAVFQLPVCVEIVVTLSLVAVTQT